MPQPLWHLAESLPSPLGACAVVHAEPRTYSLVRLDCFVLIVLDKVPWVGSARDLALRKSALGRLLDLPAQHPRAVNSLKKHNKTTNSCRPLDFLRAIV